MTMRQKQHHQHHQQQQSRVFDELVSLLTNLIRSPPSPIDLFSCAGPSLAFRPPSSSRRRALAVPSLPITPSGFASLMLGVSLALMLCGSVTFFIGFMLMPWVIGLVLVLYVVGFVSSLSILGRTIFCYASSAVFAAPSPLRQSRRKDMPPW